jgi:hypothetical protein
MPTPTAGPSDARAGTQVTLCYLGASGAPTLFHSGSSSMPTASATRLM